MVVEDREVAQVARRMGALAAFGMALTPVLIALPLLAMAAVGVQRPSGDDLEAAFAAVLAEPVLYGSTGLVFLVLGPSLIVLALALHELLRTQAPFAMRIAMAAGVIGGALITVGGFGPASLAAVLPRIESQDHQAAIAVYLANTHAPSRLSWGGMAMFGVFVVIASIAGARAGLLPRMLSYLGVFLGIMLIIGTLLLPLASIPIMVVWAAWLGIVMLRGRSRLVRSPS